MRSTVRWRRASKSPPDLVFDIRAAGSQDQVEILSRLRDIYERCIWPTGEQRVLRGSLNDNELKETNSRRDVTSLPGNTSELTGERVPPLPRQKASHQGLDLITAQRGERPSRQQSCPPASHPPAIDAPRGLTQERPSLSRHPPPASFEDERSRV